MQIERYRRGVSIWLLFVAGMVLFMIIVGGLTRLTQSGLSMVEWRPLMGTIPPITEAEWLDVFAKYKAYPEYQKVNKGMSLSEFKPIFYFEYSHRILGRLIGLVFALPAVFFWIKKAFPKAMIPKMLLLFVLGGAQGVIGWWMVKSGLVDRVDVSQYRLAVHLTLACVIFAYALWVARGLAWHSTHITPPNRLRLFAPLVATLVMIQIFMGGLVAGLDAGLASNEWPKMLGEWVPEDISAMTPLWINWFENPISVQFNHRISAYILLLVILIQWWIAKSSNAEAPHKRRTMIIVVLAFIQAVIGILTVLWEVPINTALTHQAFAVVLLAAVVAHWRGLVGPYPPVTSLEVRA